MAGKATQQGLAFLQTNSTTQKQNNTAAQKQNNTAAQKSPVLAKLSTRQRGEVWRANLFLDKELEDYLALKARHDKKSISVLVSEILMDYKKKNPQI